jgi:hypothetical protein
MASPYATGSGTSGFSKSITSALNMLDATDAEARLNNAYYQAYGTYPSQQKIERFRDKFNAELKNQTAKTTTTTSSTGRGTASTSSTTKSVTEGLGFTETEQNQFLADFLQSNYKITGKEQSGYVKSVITNLQNLYKSNLLPEDSMENMIAFAAELVGTADQNVATQKFTAKSDSIRAIAAKLNPGVADLLTNGQNISDVLDPIVKGVNNSLGTAFTKEDPRFKEVLNFNDGKTTRAMTTTEIDKFIAKQPEYQTSAAGINKYASWGQALKDALK